MNEYRLKLFSLAILMLSATLSKAASETLPDPLNLLRKALHPPVAYTCKIVVSSWGSPKGDTALLREWRLPDGRYRIEYLSPKNLRGTVLISDGKKRWRIVKGKAMWGLEVDELTPERLDLLSKNYRLTVLGSTAVLGRKAWQVAISPKVKGKPHHKFWLDAEHGIILKGEISDERDVPIAFMSVTELKFLNPKEVSHRLFATPVKVAATKSQKQLTKVQAQNEWSLNLPDSLPFGFLLERVEEVELPKNLRTLHAVYTDGLTKISLFVLPSNLKPSLGASRISVVRKPLGKRVLLVVGSVDKSLLERIANSF